MADKTPIRVRIYLNSYTKNGINISPVHHDNVVQRLQRGYGPHAWYRQFLTHRALCDDDLRLEPRFLNKNSVNFYVDLLFYEAQITASNKRTKLIEEKVNNYLNQPGMTTMEMCDILKTRVPYV